MRLPPLFPLEPTEESLSLREALVRMVCDTDHRVRMHMVKEATALYFGGEDGLPSRQLQEDTFQQITKMLHKAHLVPVSWAVEVSMVMWVVRLFVLSHASPHTSHTQHTQHAHHTHHVHTCTHTHTHTIRDGHTHTHTHTSDGSR